MDSTKAPPCIGRYCGYQPSQDDPGQWDLNKCGACPWGYRSNATKYCTKCENLPAAHDWLFLTFMAVLPCMFNWIFILRTKSGKKVLAAQMILSTMECVCAGIFALLSTEPTGSLAIVSCGVEGLSDWYPMFYNPQIRYTETIHCTQEAVYPLLTTVCIYYAYSLCLMLVFRPLVLRIFSPPKQWRDPIYSALYFHPILVITQAMAGGLLYYAFPYITVTVSLAAIAVYFVWSEVTKLSALGEKAMRNLLIILWHFSLVAFGIVSISMTNFNYLSLVPIAVLFFFITLKFTDPDHIDQEWRH